ncbi:heme exporter protein CcmD [Lutibaculum baratangense]|uniref:Heme exporter protein D n=1 Tax=Lutibaculum baratangense AMV1 TaxID=631454 RepID=V4RS66_9HYPH|nr:hypothetical protein N177_1300 [Lutibaculum baratangense AMV1]
MSHMGFVVAAYSATALIVVGLIAWVRLDGAAQRQALEELGDRPRGGRD